MMGQNDLERTIKRGARVVNGDCSNCPFLRLYSYPVCYCLHAMVDWSTKCPYDYNHKRAQSFYDEHYETIRFWDEYMKKQIWGDCFVNVPQ